MEDVVIVAALRTGVGKFGGTIAKIPASDLGAHVIKALLAKTGIKSDQVSEVIMGQVLTAGVGQNPARQALIKAGIADMVPAMTIGKVCGSGLKATHLAAQAIKCGDAEIVIAGGQENMSASPHVLNGSRDGIRMGDGKLIDTMIVDGLWDVYNQYHMGITAENVAKKYEVSRKEQDEFAAASQNKAEAAQKAHSLGLKPIAKIKAYSSAGIDPKIMGMGPVPATQLCLRKAGWSAKDLDLMEINEAFAAQAIGVNREMGWDTSKINVNGGAIAIGHPIGASGCRILVTLLHEMIRRDAKKGLASLCIGGGMGVALAVER